MLTKGYRDSNGKLPVYREFGGAAILKKVNRS
jgi:hypothetical protein